MSIDHPPHPCRAAILLVSGLLSCIVLAALSHAAVAAPTWSGVIQKQDPPQENDQFGVAVGVSGSTMVIGAPGVGPLSGSVHLEGAAYFYTLSGGAWQRTATFTGSDGDLGHGDAFGHAVAIDGDVAVVGAPEYKASSPYDRADGMAYVYRRVAGQWQLDGTLTAAGDAALESFGCSVVVANNTIVVGACLYDNGSTPSHRQRGAAFVYAYTAGSWSQVATLVAPDAGDYDGFGTSLAIDGDTIVVGAPGKDIAGNSRAGAAYVFANDGSSWVFTDRLIADDGASDDNFGQSVALSGDSVLVGAHAASNADESIGAIYAFHRNGSGWVQSQRFTAADNDDWIVDLGMSIAMQGHTAIAGAPLSMTANGMAGAACVFSESGGQWTRTAVIPYPQGSGEVPTEFGWSVALDGPTALVGSLQVLGPGSVLVATSPDLVFRDGFE